MKKGDVITDGMIEYEIIRIGKKQATIKNLHPMLMGVRIIVTINNLNNLFKLK